MEKKKQDVPVRMPPRRVEPPRMFPVLNPDRIMAIIEAQCGDVHIAKRYGEGANKVFILRNCQLRQTIPHEPAGTEVCRVWSFLCG